MTGHYYNRLSRTLQTLVMQRIRARRNPAFRSIYCSSRKEQPREKKPIRIVTLAGTRRRNRLFERVSSDARRRRHQKKKNNKHHCPADSCAVHTAKLMELVASRVRDLYCCRSGIEGEGKDSMTGWWLVHEGCMINTYRKHENAVNGLLRLTSGGIGTVLYGPNQLISPDCGICGLDGPQLKVVLIQ